MAIINHHNNTIHSSTKFKHIDLLNATDENIIKAVNENIEKNINYPIKYKDQYILENNDYLLVNNNISIKKFDDEYYTIITKNKKCNGDFTIPARFISYTKGTVFSSKSRTKNT